MTSSRIILSKHSWLDVFDIDSGLLPDTKSFDRLWKLHPEGHSYVKIWGNLQQVPRWQQSYLRNYKFSGVVSEALPLPKEFSAYLRWANNLGYGEFNEVLVNWYQDGNNYIGSHSDDESALVPGSPILTLTLSAKGLPRKFRIRSKVTKVIIEDLETTNGKVIVMGGHCQKEFKHEIPKVTGAKASQMGARISVTMRQFA